MTTLPIRPISREKRMDTDSYSLWCSRDKRYTLSHRSAGARPAADQDAPQSPNHRLSATEAERIDMLMTELARRLEDRRTQALRQPRLIGL